MRELKKEVLIKKFLRNFFNGKLIFRRFILIILDIILITGSLISSSLLLGEGTYFLFISVFTNRPVRSYILMFTNASVGSSYLIVVVGLNGLG